MELLNIKPFQETLNSSMCGPASLKMILSYYGVEKTERELARLCQTDSNIGTNAVSLKQVAESLGFNVEVKNQCTFDDIQQWINKKVPVIINWFSKGRSDYDESVMADGHYSLVVGLDEQYIYLQDPEIGGLRKIARDDFLRVWFDFTGSYIRTLDEMILRQIIAISK